MSDIKPTFQGEVQLAGWTQTHNSGVKLTLWLADERDLEPFKAMTARKGRQAGQRMMAVFVEIGDDEQPVQGEAPRESKALRLSAIQVCKADAFQQFVANAAGYMPQEAAEREQLAADHIKRFCRIESRADLDKSPTGAQLFARLMQEYREWCRATGVQS
jgi:hypothetical protein